MQQIKNTEKRFNYLWLCLLLPSCPTFNFLQPVYGNIDLYARLSVHSQMWKIACAVFILFYFLMKQIKQKMYLQKKERGTTWMWYNNYSDLTWNIIFFNSLLKSKIIAWNIMQRSGDVFLVQPNPKKFELRLEAITLNTLHLLTPI